jgi:hypothetical protein
MTHELTLLLICADAPPEMREGRVMEFGAQDKAGVLQPGAPQPDGSLRFTLPVSVRLLSEDELEFAGPFVHGVRGGRFFYLGYRQAGERLWARRWKIPLAGITPELSKEASSAGKALLARVSATGGSTIYPLGMGWTLK